MSILSIPGVDRNYDPYEVSKNNYEIPDIFDSYTNIAFGINEHGEIVGWGSDTDNMATLSPKGNDFVSLGIASHNTAAIKKDGSIVCWGSTNAISCPKEGVFNKVCGGNNVMLALRNDGTLHAWGQDNYGIVSNTPKDGDFIDIASDKDYNLYALKKDGTIVSWGISNYGINNLEYPFVKIAAGDSTLVALKEDGSIYGTGNDYYGAISKIPEGTDYVDVDITYKFGGAIRRNGSVILWGSSIPIIPDMNDAVKIKIANQHVFILKKDSTIVGYGVNTSGIISGLPNTKFWNLPSIQGEINNTVFSKTNIKEDNMDVKSDIIAVKTSYKSLDKASEKTINTLKLKEYSIGSSISLINGGEVK